MGLRLVMASERYEADGSLEKVLKEKIEELSWKLQEIEHQVLC
jgi:hypothetical protein